MGGMQVEEVRGLGRLRKTFLKILTKGALTTEAGSLFHHLMTLSSGGSSYHGVLLRGVLYGRVEWEGEKK